MFSTLSQGAQLLLMACAGLFAGAACLLLAAARRAMRAGFFLSLACDALLGAVWALLFCAAVMRAARGEARFFHALAFCAGAHLAVSAVSAPAKACARGLRAVFRRAARSKICRTVFK